jgi:hypothetical protein
VGRGEKSVQVVHDHGLQALAPPNAQAQLIHQLIIATPFVASTRKLGALNSRCPFFRRDERTGKVQHAAEAASASIEA